MSSRKLMLQLACRLDHYPDNNLHMWFCCKKNDSKENIPTATAVALIVAVVSLALAAGVCRWSWLIVDEQIRLRRALAELQDSQAQLNTQFEFWNQQIQKERQEIKDAQMPE